MSDHYLVGFDRACNAKIRDGRLKIKRLVDERSGYQGWVDDGASTPAANAEGVTVEKIRTIYRLGDVRGEIAELFVVGCGLRLASVAIQGTDIRKLEHVRSVLGLSVAANVPVHVAIDCTLRRMGGGGLQIFG